MEIKVYVAASVLGRKDVENGVCEMDYVAVAGRIVREDK